MTTILTQHLQCLQVAQSSDTRLIDTCQSPVTHSSDFVVNKFHDHEQLLYGGQT